MVRFIRNLLILMFLIGEAQADSCVILLHGLARTHSSMVPLAEALTAAGYQTVNLGYPSRKQTIEELAVAAIEPALEACGNETTIHFVTHSLGGILVRQYLGVHKVVRLGRVVMLGPPNQGSEVVDRLGAFPGFGWINGPAGQQLGTGPASLPRHLGPASFEVGIIAGNRSFNLVLSHLLPEPNDGKVSVASTRLEGMADHLELPVTHTFMMRNTEVVRQVLAFLANGRFARVMSSAEEMSVEEIPPSPEDSPHS